MRQRISVQKESMLPPFCQKRALGSHKKAGSDTAAQTQHPATASRVAIGPLRRYLFARRSRWLHGESALVRLQGRALQNCVCLFRARSGLFFSVSSVAVCNFQSWPVISGERRFCSPFLNAQDNAPSRPLGTQFEEKQKRSSGAHEPGGHPLALGASSPLARPAIWSQGSS